MPYTFVKRCHCQPRNIKKNSKRLLQSAVDSYYQLWWLFCYKMRHGLIQIAMGITKARPAKPYLAYFKTFSLKKASTKAGWNKALDREMVNEVCLLGTTPIESHCKPGRGRETRAPANLPNCTSLTRFWETNRGCSKAEIRLRETPGVGPCNRYVYRSKGINYFNFIFGLNYIFLCFWVWLCMIKKRKLKLNHG